MRLEKQILSNLILCEDYTRKTIAFLKEDYFLDAEFRVVFASISDHFQKYNQVPSKNALVDFTTRKQTDNRRPVC